MTAKAWRLLAFLAISGSLPALHHTLADTASAPDGGLVLVVDIQGAIGPATRDYVRLGLSQARERDAQALVLRLDTPGGLVDSTRDINLDILASPIPVVTWVAPEGARAASAGTYILYASHVAAMAPATHLGAATPVAIDGATPAPPANEPLPGGGAEDPLQPGSSASELKSIEDAVAYVRALAELRDRNADWAERAVREAATLSSARALEENVIDFVAVSLDDLLRQMHGLGVAVPGGTIVLDTADARVEEVRPNWRIQFLAVLTNPTLAYMLMLIGMYGLIFEGYNPGAIVPGVVGAISLLLALFAFQILPVNYAGLALIVLGMGLIVAETLTPSFGALGLGGTAALVIGSIILMDTPVPGFEISTSAIVAIAIAASALTFALGTMALRMRQQPVVGGIEFMVGAEAEALEDFDTHGAVWAEGERWNANTTLPVRKGQRLRITAIHGLQLEVEPLPERRLP